MKFICLDLDNSSGITNILSNASESIAKSDKQAINTVVNKANQWSHPKPFKDESDEAKLCMILNWIYGPGSHEGILIGTEKINNITIFLKKMKFNGYLRLVGVDMNILKSRMSENSWTLFEDFQSKHKDGAWKCPQCNSFFAHDQVKWKCDRCLFFYHEICAEERKIKGNEEYSLCSSCFFALEIDIFRQY